MWMKNIRIIENKKLVAQSAETVEYTDCFSAGGESPRPNECTDYDIKQSDGDTGALGNAVYLFVAITPRSILTWRCRTESGPIFRSNRTVWHSNSTHAKLNSLKIEVFLHLTVCKQKTVLLLDWIVWNRTVYMYKNRYAIK